MALMEDTGWYLPNYAMAEELTWGAGLGCDFALKSCKETMTKMKDFAVLRSAQQVGGGGIGGN